jgi:hypothetical protein
MTTKYEESNNVDINAWRNGYKWSVNECLRLEREYDLLKMSVPAMAILHKRTINAIMFKLQAEGLDTYNNLYVQTFGQDHVNQQIEQLNNLCSKAEDLDEDYETDEDDKSDPDLDDETDEEYVPDLNDEDEDDDDEDVPDQQEDDGSNRAYIFEQVKSIHKHINNLLAYFTSGSKSKQVSSITANACI